MDFSPLRLAILSVEDCTRFCNQPDVTPALCEKVDREIEQLRRLCTQLLCANADSPAAEEVGDADESEGSIVLSTARDQSGYGVAVSKLLEVAVNHFLSRPSPAPSASIACAYSYLTLGRASTTKPGGLPSRGAFSFLQRAEIALRNLGQLGLNHGTALETLRSLALAHWVFGLAFYRQEQFAAAVPYIRLACHLGEEILSMDEENDALNPALVSLIEQIPKRWELLGCCEARTGDHKVWRPTFLYA